MANGVSTQTWQEVRPGAVKKVVAFQDQLPFHASQQVRKCFTVHSTLHQNLQIHPLQKTQFQKPSTEELPIFQDHLHNINPLSRLSLQDPPTTQTEMASSNTPQSEAQSFSFNVKTQAKK